MLSAVHLNDQTRVETREVRDIAPNNVLPPETGAADLPLPERQPKTPFRLRHVTPKASRPDDAHLPAKPIRHSDSRISSRITGSSMVAGT